MANCSGQLLERNMFWGHASRKTSFAVWNFTVRQVEGLFIGIAVVAQDNSYNDVAAIPARGEAFHAR